MRVLLVSYSQTGDTNETAAAFLEPLRASGATIEYERLRPVTPYPFPWQSLFRFFGVLPECQLGPAPPLEPLRYASPDDFDLVVLAYQVWFLAPSLPFRAYLETAGAGLRGRKVITLCVSRNMWNSASETMKRWLQSVGSLHCDNVVITHQGPPWATFLATPALLLWGRRKPLLAGFPSGGVGPAELGRAQRLGEVVAQRRSLLNEPGAKPLLGECGGVTIERRYVAGEWIGLQTFRVWARVLRAARRAGALAANFALALFMLFLVSLVVVGLPLLILSSLLWRPLMRRRIEAYVRRLAQPSGEFLLPPQAKVLSS